MTPRHDFFDEAADRAREAARKVADHQHLWVRRRDGSMCSECGEHRWLQDLNEEEREQSRINRALKAALLVREAARKVEAEEPDPFCCAHDNEPDPLLDRVAKAIAAGTPPSCPRCGSDDTHADIASDYWYKVQGNYSCSNCAAGGSQSCWEEGEIDRCPRCKLGDSYCKCEEENESLSASG